MKLYEKIWDFLNLYKAHLKAKKNKQGKQEVVQYEMNLGYNLTKLSLELKNKTYCIKVYYSFKIYDPKERNIDALYYQDRIVQHCLCDEVLEPLLDKRLIYDNAACRKNKGTHFALKRVKHFLCNFHKKFQNQGYFLKCDIKKFFENIDHDILKKQLRTLINDEDLLWLLDLIIDSYHSDTNKGLPMGNQTSQWFAIFYLNSFDRFLKEYLQIKYYSRYMDDMLLIHDDKNYLKDCLWLMNHYITKELKLSFNSKTKIFPIKQGVLYLGWHIYQKNNGKIILKVSSRTKRKYKRRLKLYQYKYKKKKISMHKINQKLNSQEAHLKFGNTYYFRKNNLSKFKL